MQASKVVENTIKTETFKQTTITFSATFINGTLGFLFYVVTARFLGPENFGLLIISLTVLALVADIGNFGINAGIVNFVSKNKKNKEVSMSYLKLGLKLKLLIGIVTLILGFILAPLLCVYVFNKPHLITPLRLAFAGVGTTWLFSFITSYYQSFEKFISWGLIQIFANFLRLFLVLVFVYASILTVNSSMVFYITAPLIGFLLAMSFIPKGFLKVENEDRYFGKFIKFNKWVGLSAIAASLSSKMDTFILATLLGAREVGIYSAAYQIVQVIPQLISALGTVVAPKFASLTNKNEMLMYFKKTQTMVVGVSLLGLLGIPVFKLLIPALMGAKYNDSFPIFSILLIGLLLFLIATPVHNAIIYYYNYPKLLSHIAYINLFILLLLGYFATIKFGIIGMAAITVLLNFLNLIIPSVWMKLNVDRRTAKQ